MLKIQKLIVFSLISLLLFPKYCGTINSPVKTPKKVLKKDVELDLEDKVKEMFQTPPTKKSAKKVDVDEIGNESDDLKSRLYAVLKNSPDCKDCSEDMLQFLVETLRSSVKQSAEQSKASEFKHSVSRDGAPRAVQTNSDSSSYGDKINTKLTYESNQENKKHDEEIKNLEQEGHELESRAYTKESENVQKQLDECSTNIHNAETLLSTKKTQFSNVFPIMNAAHENTKSGVFELIDDCAEYYDQWKNSNTHEKSVSNKPINIKNIDACFQKVTQYIKSDGAAEAIAEKVELERKYEDLENKQEWTEGLLIGVSVTQLILIFVFIVWGWKLCKKRKEKKKNEEKKKRNSINNRRLNSIADFDLPDNNELKISPNDLLFTKLNSAGGYNLQSKPNCLPVLTKRNSSESEATIYDSAPQPLTYEQHLAKRSLSKVVNAPKMQLNIKHYDENLRKSNEFMKFKTLIKAKKFVTFQSHIEFI